MQDRYPNTLKLSVGLWPFHLDFKSRYPLHRLISRMVHVAGEHSKTCGYGIQEMLEHSRTWVLNKISMEFEEDVDVDLPLDITTGVTTWRSVSTERAILLSQQDRLLVRSNSRWVALSTETRYPIALDEIFSPDLPLTELPDITLPAIPRHIAKPEIIKQLKPIFKHRIRYSDLDINGHMNTASWVRLAQDALPLERWETGHLLRVRAAFNREGIYSEEISVEWTSEGMTDYCRLSIDNMDAFWLVLEWKDFSFKN